MYERSRQFHDFDGLGALRAGSGALKVQRALVTGGAGFIGSSLVESLLRKKIEITVFDNFSAQASRKTVDELPCYREVRVVEGDCTNDNDVTTALEGVDTVFHLAANPEVRLDRADEETCVRQNVTATFTLLKAMKKSNAKTMAFASSSTVYGEPHAIPTPESYAPLLPISIYGAAKLASEALISAYCNSFGMRGVILRLANIVGERSGHGVVPDFVKKLSNDPTRLDVLGDGLQKKSYLYVDDCVDGIIKSVVETDDRVAVYNVGGLDSIPVNMIARIVASAMGLNDLDISYSGGTRDGRGWVGDVKKMQLDVGKLRNLGWHPLHDSAESVRLTAEGIAALHAATSPSV